MADPGVDGLALLQRQLKAGQPPAALDAEQVRARRLALQATLQHGVDLVLRARARVHELLAPRQPASQHAAALVGHPHRLQLARPQQPRQRARVEPIGLRARLRDPGVVRADHDHPIHMRLEDPRHLPAAARHLQRHPIRPQQALAPTTPGPPACSAPERRCAPRPPRRSRPRRSHGERPARSRDRPTSTTPSSPPPTQLTTSGRTSGTTTQTDTCSQHNPGKSQGRPNEKPGLEAHRAKRPTRLRSPNRSPCPGSPDPKAGPGQRPPRAFSCHEREQRPTRGARTCWLLLFHDACVSGRTQLAPAGDDPREHPARRCGRPLSPGGSRRVRTSRRRSCASSRPVATRPWHLLWLS